MKKMVTMLMVLSLFSFAAYGQYGWTGGLGTERADTLDAYGHGVAVDGAGKIWYSPYYASETVMIDTGSGSEDFEQAVHALYVFNPDGSEAAFSPITEVTVDGVTTPFINTSCGLETDPDGNVCYSSYWEVFKLNATTGEGMMHVLPEDSSTLTKVAFTDAGEMIVSFVLPGNGINIYDADWALISKAIPGESTNAYARTVEVAPDGSALYYCEFTGGNGLVRFNSDSDIYGDFTSSSDTLTPGFAVESANWDPTGTYLWAGHTAGSGAWSAAAHYAFDPANNFAIVDSMVLPASEVDLGIKPRGIDFAPDGNTAYVTFFNSWDSDPIYKFEKDAVGVWQHTGSFIAGYSLKAAYPNPFNPSTKLDITMKEAGVADLRVYDLRGAEVAVLSNSYMPAGDHTFTFDGSNLSAGVYIAKLTVNGAMYTQSMTLVK